MSVQQLADPSQRLEIGSALKLDHRRPDLQVLGGDPRDMVWARRAARVPKRKQNLLLDPEMRAAMVGPELPKAISQRSDIIAAAKLLGNGKRLMMVVG
jgi:hypothetical protein